MPSYTTQSKVEDYLKRSLTTREANQISDYIEAASVYIDNYTRNDFEQVSEIRYFDGNGNEELLVDTFSSINSVEILDQDGNVDQTLTQGQANDFITFPYNESAKWKLILEEDADLAVWPDSDAFSSGFPERRKAVKIDADWGDTSTPKPIELAATQLTANLINKADKGGVAASESLGDYAIEYKDVDEQAENLGVKSLLDRYKQYIL